ncbi:MAG: ribonuclease P protein component [Candidatus Nealsonbacteria bacterium RIFCSPLOWO2_12_FULL_39_31]|uniref:Ribonuclease P protein component n=3 Tax=Candidatus Nealsoniibacteriota TaxID=1817911 RepID=A0A1G2EK22_9BACT|nr:MAG: Ribonuclease P protein component [Parcubacteria group bacterium GW2011_GWA2_38_27]KKQ96933.1 MAG: Ribonuclease P protein component [Parcubacteria group bacterium GW2011_GWC2_39_11]OGZ20101.1 MAG: ribonuclease P protein component [Candidatus Nealsonbacteria bacterium RIFCSPHIGHO2_01_FULL_38_55]OGZ20625.1 MAG: ribonuclease P protein component [Candidatus Nealsonbacteria bacterium RIFCSPHIGHO2_02_38_10]OGZ22111.1 MAG: ribonuclease P protein component [Candidatus Nealsonbacteria bacterium R
MLSKENRLKKKKDFEDVFKNGRGYKDGFLYLKIIKNNLEPSRFGFVVGVKFSKSAVKRNKIKRWLRELTRINLQVIEKGFDCVVIVFPGFKAKNFEEAEGLAEKLFRRAGIIKQ